MWLLASIVKVTNVVANILKLTNTIANMLVSIFNVANVQQANTKNTKKQKNFNIFLTANN